MHQMKGRCLTVSRQACEDCGHAPLKAIAIRPFWRLFCNRLLPRALTGALSGEAYIVPATLGETLWLHVSCFRLRPPHLKLALI